MTMQINKYRKKSVHALVVTCQYLPLANYCNLFIYDLRITTIPTFFEPVLDSSRRESVGPHLFYQYLQFLGDEFIADTMRNLCND